MSDCLFCGIADGKIKANLVYQDEARAGVQRYRTQGTGAYSHHPAQACCQRARHRSERQRCNRPDLSGRRPTGARAGHRRQRLSRGGQFRR